MNKIFLRDMKAEILIDVYDWKHRHVQTLLLDLDIGISEKAMLPNDIDETVHYGDVCGAVHASLRKQDFLLLEVLAEHVADLALHSFGVLWVRVRTVEPGTLPDVKKVGVEVERGASR